MKKELEGQFSAETLSIIGGHDPANAMNSIKNPIYQTSTFKFNTAEEGKAFFNTQKEGATLEERNNSLIYTRLNHPNLVAAEYRLAQLDGAEDSAFFESGMAAISTAILTFCKAGDLIALSSPLYGGTDKFVKGILSAYDVEYVEFDSSHSQQEIQKLILTHPRAKNLKMIYVETPANPTLSLTDFSVITAVKANLASQGIQPVLAADNTYMGPIFQHPLAHGFDIILYSATKYIGGHSDVIAGACSGKMTLLEDIKKMRSILGCMASPFTSWLLTRSLETVGLRMQKQATNAATVAQFLNSHPKVRKVYFMDLLEEGSEAYQIFKKQQKSAGAMMAFDVQGGEKEAFTFLNSLQLIHLAISLGSTETLASHPYTMSSSNMAEADRLKNNITPALIRISIGIENPDDLIRDLNQALEKV